MPRAEFAVTLSVAGRQIVPTVERATAAPLSLVIEISGSRPPSPFSHTILLDYQKYESKMLLAAQADLTIVIGE